MSAGTTRRVEVLCFAGLIVALTAVLAMNVMLQASNRRLEAKIHGLSQADGPTIGSRISTLHGVDPLHQTSSINTAGNGKKTLLLIFSPTCPYCKLNLPIWQAILKKHTDINVVYVDLAGTATESYLSSSGLDPRFPLLSLNAEEKVLYEFRVTPTTVLLDGIGTVKGSWTGLMTAQEARQIDRLLDES